MSRAVLPLAVILMLVGLFANQLVASVAIPEWDPKEWPANPERHKLSVIRNATTAQENAAIRVAEAAYPPRHEVLEAFQGEVPQEEKRLWWYWEMSDTKIPYAITREAIDYYTRRVKQHRTESDNGYWEPHSNFAYRADAKRHDGEITLEDGSKFSRVWVVDMKMDYTRARASGFMMMFAKNRKVVLDYNYRVLAIFGDGETPVAVT